MDQGMPTHQTHKPKTSDLLASAKVVASAAKATVSHETTKVDKAKVAGATADLLGAAKHYGKLEEKGLGKYVDKAENYLHKYQSSSTATTTSSSSSSTNSTNTSSNTATHDQSGGGSGGGGYGDYIKLAEGLFKGKHGDGDGAQSGGYGDYIKKAEGFLKKH